MDEDLNKGYKEAWFAVVSTLTKVQPEWVLEDFSGVKAACKTIEKLAKNNLQLQVQDPCSNCNPDVLCRTPYCARLKPNVKKHLQFDPNSIYNIPDKVLESEQVISNFFAEKGVANWKLGNIQSRE